MARISVEALIDLIGAGTAPSILDVRSELQRDADPFLIPGAVVLQKADPNGALTRLPKGHPVIVYCACPNEASAALMARQLRKLGLTNIRPLAGGIDAWRAAGLPVERACRQLVEAATMA
jgi:rhodanese-related sulfurtransferase